MTLADRRKWQKKLLVSEADFHRCAQSERRPIALHRSGFEWCHVGQMCVKNLNFEW